jgi:hypothetical protein
MATVTLNLSKVNDSYGSTGEDAAKKMQKSFASRSLDLSYNSTSQKFTVLGSSAYKREQIEKIFVENRFDGWHPSVLDEVDAEGNHLIKLLCVPGDDHERSEWTGDEPIY